MILFIEQDSEGNELRFIRRLEQLCQSELMHYVKGVIIGKFQRENYIDTEKLKKIIHNQRKLQKVPVISNANFGHVMPIFTFPIG
ncbi:microcin C7 resistance protein MccF-like protein [bacterium]|nr:microcin C7 resistance protein MccF-like protein [bacterium]